MELIGADGLLNQLTTTVLETVERARLKELENENLGLRMENEI